MRNLSPNQEGVLQEQAKEAYANEDFEEALKLYRVALPSSRGKERQLLLSNIVACRLNIGGSAQAEAAVDNAKQCIALNDQWAKGHVRLASAYIALGGHSNDACNSLQRAIQLDPGHPTARQMLVQELRRDHRLASRNQQDLDNHRSDGSSNSVASEPGMPYSNRESSAPSRATIFDMDDPSAPSSDSSLSWFDYLQLQFTKAVRWYYSQSEDRRNVIHVCLVFLFLYVAFGGRFGFEECTSSSATKYRKGNYGTGNAYDQHYGRHSSSPEPRHTSYNANYQAQYSSHHPSQSSSYSGYDSSTQAAGSFFDQWDGHLTPILLLVVGATYLCHRNGIPITEAVSFVVWNILFRRGRYCRWGLGARNNGIFRQRRHRHRRY
ncbi:unnamed protein product [Cylindrotheca closterium]|uniref:Uncharacterized protein n=1 Tax=Cylindrotheca closterium TaxID=2856 RepID=A0AAD2FCE4_9STRA|nr:unnamed protein product [Cylindrotheca closterium]CAJ1948721.1 unnamed protein product [Cylindrotheca closterium]